MWRKDRPEVGLFVYLQYPTDAEAGVARAGHEMCFW
jgi:hypothetical protein